MTQPAPPISWILFDLGNVIVDYRPGGIARMAASLELPPERVEAAVLLDDAVPLRTGRESPARFAARMSRTLGVAVSPRDVVDWFGPDIEHVFPEIPPLLAELSARYRLGVLSNAFFGPWDRFLQMSVARLFHRLLASHLLGYLKPDLRIYQAALAHLGAPATRVLFIDDKEPNVAGARAAGMHAFSSACPADTIAGLCGLGILPDRSA